MFDITACGELIELVIVEVAGVVVIKSGSVEEESVLPTLLGACFSTWGSLGANYQPTPVGALTVSVSWYTMILTEGTPDPSLWIALHQVCIGPWKGEAPGVRILPTMSSLSPSYIHQSLHDS